MIEARLGRRRRSQYGVDGGSSAGSFSVRFSAPPARCTGLGARRHRASAAERERHLVQRDRRRRAVEGGGRDFQVGAGRGAKIGAVASANNPAQATISACSSRRFCSRQPASVTASSAASSCGERRQDRVRRGRIEAAHGGGDQRGQLREPPGSRFQESSMPASSSSACGFVAGASRQERLKYSSARAARAGHAEALALVHAAAVGGDLAERRAQQRAVAADVELEEAVQVVGRLDAPGRTVPEDSPRLPGGDAVRELLGVKPADRRRRGTPPPPASPRRCGGRGCPTARARTGSRSRRGENGGSPPPRRRAPPPCPRCAASPRGSSRSRSRGRG